MAQLRRAGMVRTNSAVAIGCVIVLGTLALPAIQMAREKARRAHCTGNLRQLGQALHSYQDSNRLLPPAAVWSAGDLEIKTIYRTPWKAEITHQNWLQQLLPYLGEERLAAGSRPEVPITDRRHQELRTTGLLVAKCPSDTYNRPGNLYRYEPPNRPARTFARGNYAINGGSHNDFVNPGTPAAPSASGHNYVYDEVTRQFQWWGTGVAGFNKSFGLSDFANKLSSTVAIDEMRAGIHELDPRGVWALGQIGASVTWSHGVLGDDCGPNNQGVRADDIVGCGRLHQVVGAERLTEQCMPCCSYFKWNAQATARSMHPGGVNVLMMDGSARFVVDSIDPGLWHVIHSREHSEPIALDLSEAPRPVRPEGERSPPADLTSIGEGRLAGKLSNGTKVMTNSIGMEMALIEPGQFIMGLPDHSLESEVPPESPAHEVQITTAFLLSVTEVTQAHYERVMGSNPSWHQQSSGFPNAMKDDTSSYPVEQVTWYDAGAFCKRLSNHPAELAAARVYRLPTEAEWEYACRERVSQPYEASFGESQGANLGRDASDWLPVLPVRYFRPSSLGLYGMRGNVYEWTADWFARDSYRYSVLRDPQGPLTGFLRVVRGSDWIYFAEGCRIDRYATVPWRSNRYIGFRVALDIPDAGFAASGLQSIDAAQKHQLHRQHDRLADRYRITTSSLRFGDKYLVSQNLQGRRPQILHPRLKPVDHPCWSPDGRSLLLTRWDEGAPQLFLVAHDSDEMKPLAREVAGVKAQPSWSPDGKKIAFGAIQAENNAEIYVCDADGSGIVNLTNHPAWDADPAWSPDGRSIVFTSNRVEGFYLHLLNVKDKKTRRLDFHNSRQLLSVCSPSWSPDGKELAFCALGEDGSALVLFLGDVETLTARQVVDLPGSSRHPAWSPDGRFIAFVHSDLPPEQFAQYGRLMLFDRESSTTGAIPPGKMVHSFTRPSWEPLRPGYYKLGQDLVSAGTFARFATSGWSQTNTHHVWSEGEEAEILLPLESSSQRPLVLRLRASAFLAAKHAEQDVDVVVNGELLRTLKFNMKRRQVELAIPVPAVISSSRELFRIVFRNHNPGSPSDHGDPHDKRTLGIGLKLCAVGEAQQGSPNGAAAAAEP